LPSLLTVGDDGGGSVGPNVTARVHVNVAREPLRVGDLRLSSSCPKTQPNDRKNQARSSTGTVAASSPARSPHGPARCLSALALRNACVGHHQGG